MKKTLITQTIPFLLAAMLLLGAAHFAWAGIAHSAKGWAWGGTTSPSGAYLGMGWVSFNSLDCDTDGDGFIDDPLCGVVGSAIANYGVDVPDATGGPLSGHAWSEHYGWISFNAADLAGCAPALAGATRTGNNITGGARILSIPAAAANAGGFDGCISLDGAGYGVTVAGSSLVGYAWSSDLGYLNFGGNGGNVTIFTSDLTAANATPAANTSFLISDPITFNGTARNGAGYNIPNGGQADLQIDWNSDGSVDENLDASGGSIGAINRNTTKPLTYTIAASTILVGGTHRYRFAADVNNIIAESNELNNESPWLTFFVPYSDITPAGCVLGIAHNQSTCDADVEWDLYSVPAPGVVSVSITNALGGLTVIGNASSSGGYVNFPNLYTFGVNTFTAIGNGNVIGVAARSIACMVGSAWWPLPAGTGTCFPAPVVDISATPALIPFGGTTDVQVTVKGPSAAYDCKVVNAQAADVLIAHGGNAGDQSYTVTTRNLTAAQMVTFSCTHVPTNQTTTKSIRVEVIPKVEEL